MLLILLYFVVNLSLIHWAPVEGYRMEALKKLMYPSAPGPWLPEGKLLYDEPFRGDCSTFGMNIHRHALQRFVVGPLIKKGKTVQIYKVMQDPYHPQTSMFNKDVVLRVVPVELSKADQDYESNDICMRLYIGQNWSNFEYFVEELASFGDSKFNYQVMENCPHGTLRKYMGLYKGGMPEYTEDRVKLQMHRLVFGLIALQSRLVVHGNLNLSTIHVCKNYNLKISNFGYSRVIHSRLDPKQKVYNGKAAYMAPEIFTRKEFGFAADVWSFGVILYKLLRKGVAPFEGRTRAEVYESFQKWDREFVELVGVSDAAKDLLAKIFVENPESRIDVDAIEKHKWFRNRKN